MLTSYKVRKNTSMWIKFPVTCYFLLHITSTHLYFCLTSLLLDPRFFRTSLLLYCIIYFCIMKSFVPSIFALLFFCSLCSSVSSTLLYPLFYCLLFSSLTYLFLPPLVFSVLFLCALNRLCSLFFCILCAFVSSVSSCHILCSSLTCIVVW